MCKYIDCLKHILSSIEVELCEEDIKCFASQTCEHSLKKGEFITKKGEFEKNIYFLKSGIVEYYRIVEDDTNRNVYKQTTEIAFPNEIVGEFESFITNKVSKYNIVALSDVKLISICYQALNKLCNRSEDFKLVIKKIIENQYVKKREREFNLLTKTAEEQYNLLLTKSPEVIRDTPLGVISSYLGITPQSLSRIRRKCNFLLR
ncbi:Crp/Fnr family transcriptional regulator [Tamlana sp. 2201CG12-4]|uniref:Crp/Fnr family transcriptional regulator n=1 Tax=Tamlana sp. 2201CG12-4 TaxID=3112582 RepID=UPI002DB6687F|nr:Crp/Fnr family transcriptional regulator [Tamlana sp. 2201CG12-4]MEC3908727.1 Crp/Fnr family transcriptional regulator [Tamlana sp. 2201CG12-4]